MARMGTHEQITAHRDHLWVAVVIAACVLLEVWASWLAIGAVSGFPKLGGMTTGWILPVATEAYWSYALWAWLGSSAGSRSRRFAMWTAGGMFVLSLLGQESGHLLAASRDAVPPVYVVAFVTALPLVSLALVAILVHLRQADREEAAAEKRAAEKAERQAATERAEADERTALRAQIAGMREAHADELAALNGQLDGEIDAREAAQEQAALRVTAEAARDEAQAAAEAARTAWKPRSLPAAEADQRAADAETKAARLDRKLAAAAGGKDRAGAARHPPPRCQATSTRTPRRSRSTSRTPASAAPRSPARPTCRSGGAGPQEGVHEPHGRTRLRRRVAQTPRARNLSRKVTGSALPGVKASCGPARTIRSAAVLSTCAASRSRSTVSAVNTGQLTGGPSSPLSFVRAGADRRACGRVPPPRSVETRDVRAAVDVERGCASAAVTVLPSKCR